jgi:hypothetical protein
MSGYVNLRKTDMSAKVTLYYISELTEPYSLIYVWFVQSNGDTSGSLDQNAVANIMGQEAIDVLVHSKMRWGYYAVLLYLWTDGLT